MDFDYPIRCSEPDCDATAEFKIAARWSDGLTGELKTYGLTCGRHARGWLESSRRKQALCRRAPGETLEEPRLFRLVAEARDRQLQPLTEAEVLALPAAGV
jgi:hypothetical protein